MVARAVTVSAPLASSVSSFLDRVGQFFSSLAAINWGWLIAALLLFGAYLTIRSRAYFNVLRAAYPDERSTFRRIWGAYIAAYGFNNVVPARGGDMIRLFLAKTSCPTRRYPAVGVDVPRRSHLRRHDGDPDPAVRVHAGRVPQAAGLLQARAPSTCRSSPATPRFTLFLLTALGVAVLVGFALLSRARARVLGARAPGRHDPARPPALPARGVAVQFGGWLCRFTAFWFLLEAFDVGGSVRNVLLVLGVNAVAAVVPFTPGGAGVQQALLVKVFAGTAAGATVAAYSVGQQIAIASFTLGAGLRRARDDLPLPLVQGGHRGAGAPTARRSGRREAAANGAGRRATAGPGAPRAPA